MKAIALGAAVAVSGSLLAGGWPVLKTYEGEFLDRVKMPLGGIGTGTISLAGNGALVDWEVQGAPNKGYVPKFWGWAPHFAVRTENSAGRRVARVLEGPIPLHAYEGSQGVSAANANFPRMDSVTFKAAYPLATLAFKDAELPLDVTLEAMNPLVPGDEEASGIPAALLRWRIANLTDAALKVSVCGILVEHAGGEPDDSVGRNMIVFYQSFYGLRANDLSKFAPPERSATYNREGGEYYKAYFELISKIHPESHKSKAITPHIDRWWHVPTMMPDLDDGNQAAQEQHIYSAFFWSLLGGFVDMYDEGGETLLDDEGWAELYNQLPDLSSSIVCIDYGQMTISQNRKTLLLEGLSSGLEMKLMFDHSGGEWKLIKIES